MKVKYVYLTSLIGILTVTYYLNELSSNMTQKKKKIKIPYQLDKNSIMYFPHSKVIVLNKIH